MVGVTKKLSFGLVSVPSFIRKKSVFLTGEFGDKNIPSQFYRLNSLQTKTKNIEFDLKDCYFKSGDKLNFSTKNKKYRNSLKSEDNSSYTTKLSMGSINDKIKKVTFSTVEIIRIKNFKRYNKMNTYKNNENIDTSNDSNCILF